MRVADATPTPAGDLPDGVVLLRFARSLAAAPSMEQLKQRFLAGFGRVLGVPMYGYVLVDPPSGLSTCVANGNVSAHFVTRYERFGREVDPVVKRAYDTGQPSYNMAIMSADEWLESAVYRRAYCVHRVRHVVEVPVKLGGRIVGNVHFATSAREWDIGAADIRLAEALSDVVGLTIDAIGRRDRVERERDQALAALTAAGTPFAVSDPHASDLRLNAAARRLLADVVDADELLHRLLARPAPAGGGTRRLEVELATGERANVLAQLAPLVDEDGWLVAVLAVQRESPTVPLEALATLTLREREVATLVVDGLTDREIAERLYLSHHTVSQYVKRVYRKLDVDSRVALTRELLRPRPR